MLLSSARLSRRAILAFSLALTAITVHAGKSNNTLNVAFPREVVTLDGLYSNLRENDILSLVVDDVLYTVNPETLTAQPLVALSHKMIDDRTIDVELRRGVKFHDGSELTAEDVAYSYMWTINPKSGTNFTRRIAFWLESATATGLPPINRPDRSVLRRQGRRSGQPRCLARCRQT